MVVTTEKPRDYHHLARDMVNRVQGIPCAEPPLKVALHRKLARSLQALFGSGDVNISVDNLPRAREKAFVGVDCIALRPLLLQLTTSPCVVDAPPPPPAQSQLTDAQQTLQRSNPMMPPMLTDSASAQNEQGHVFHDKQQ